MSDFFLLLEFKIDISIGSKIFTMQNSWLVKKNRTYKDGENYYGKKEKIAKNKKNEKRKRKELKKKL